MELIIKFNIDNAAFNDNTDEVTRVLEQAIKRIQNDGDMLINGYHLAISDSNGNNIGHIEISTPEEVHTYDGYFDCLGHNVGYDIFDSTTENPITVNQSDEEHVANQIAQGCREGTLNVVGPDDQEYAGCWKIV